MPHEGKNARLFSKIPESEVIEAWNLSKSKAEVLRRLNSANFGSQEKRLKDIIIRYKLPPFHLKKVTDLSITDFENAFNDPNVTTLKELCVKLGIAKKMHNAALKAEIKAKIQSENLQVPKNLHKAIFGVSATPWTYPRRLFILQNQAIPTTCSQCGFVASVPQQIQLHHKHPGLDSNNRANSNSSLGLEEGLDEDNKNSLDITQQYKGSSLKKSKDYNLSGDLVTICANCHSLKHHPRGPVEKAQCGLWLNKKTTNRAYENHMDMFVKNCTCKYTLQKKYLIRTILKTPNDYVCSSCVTSEWKGKQLVLQLHHKDGNQTNAELSNLVLLCPNCHAACHGVPS